MTFAEFMVRLHAFFDIFLKGGGLMVLVLAAKWIAAKIPENTKIHSGHATAAVVMQTAVEAFERIGKGFLSGPYLDQILTAYMGGVPLAIALSRELPDMVAALRTAIGPQATAILTAVFGVDGEKKQLEGVVIAAVHALIDDRQPAPKPVLVPTTPPPTPPALPTTPAAAPALVAVPAPAPVAGA